MLLSIYLPWHQQACSETVYAQDFVITKSSADFCKSNEPLASPRCTKASFIELIKDELRDELEDGPSQAGSAGSGDEFRVFLCFIGDFSLSCLCSREASSPSLENSRSPAVPPMCGYLYSRLECDQALPWNEKANLVPHLIKTQELVLRDF